MAIEPIDSPTIVEWLAYMKPLNVKRNKALAKRYYQQNKAKILEKRRLRKERLKHND